MPEAKTLQELVADATELSSAAGRTVFSMGVQMAPLMADPKKVAQALLEMGDQFEAIGDSCRKLANDVCDYHAAAAKRIIVPNGVS